jgi:hypothetical protein
VLKRMTKQRYSRIPSAYLHPSRWNVKQDGVTGTKTEGRR